MAMTWFSSTAIPITLVTYLTNSTDAWSAPEMTTVGGSHFPAATTYFSVSSSLIHKATGQFFGRFASRFASSLSP